MTFSPSFRSPFDQPSVAEGATGAIIVPLDAPPLVKLAQHLRGAGFIAVAFPTDVLVLIGRQEGCCGRAATVRIKSFSEALGILRSAEPAQALDNHAG